MGINDTKEVVHLLAVMCGSVLDEAKKDGFQVKDLLAFLQSKDFQDALGPAVEGAQNIPAEIKDLSYIEGFELARYCYSEFDAVFEKVKDLA